MTKEDMKMLRKQKPGCPSCAPCPSPSRRTGLKVSKAVEKEADQLVRGIYGARPQVSMPPIDVERVAQALLRAEERGYRKGVKDAAKIFEYEADPTHNYGTAKDAVLSLLTKRKGVRA